jgi:hypothetical protein
VTKLVRAISASKERASLTFADGLCGSIPWHEVVRDTGMVSGVFRLDSARPSPDGDLLLVDYFWREHERAPQGPDKTAEIPVDRLYKAVSEGENFKRVVQVDGQFGTQSLAFVYVGRQKGFLGTEAEARDLQQWEVQDWYTARGFPRAGSLLSVDRRGRAKACWQLV